MIKSEVLQIRLSKEEKEYIKKMSRRNKMSMSDFLLYGAMKSISEIEFNHKNSELL